MIDSVNRRSPHRIAGSGHFPLRAAVLRFPQGTLAVFSGSEALKAALVEAARSHGVEILGDGTFGLTRSAQILIPEPTILSALVGLTAARRCSLTPVGGQRRLAMLLAAGSTGGLEPVAGDPWYDTLLDITATLPVWDMRLPEGREELRSVWSEVAMLLAESAS